jgi:ABC-2 type transport system permease protein
VTWALFWFALSVWVNSRGGTSAGNALLLVGVWLVVVVVVPGLVHIAVDTLYPPPSSIEAMHDAREDAGEVERALSGLEGTHNVDPNTRDFAQKRVAMQDALMARTKPGISALRETLNERQAMVDWLRFLSPAIVVQLALEDVAGSGAVRHQRFDDQLDAFHTRYRAFFSARIRSGAQFTAADLAARPQMTFEEESVGALAGRMGGGVAGLALLTLLLLLGAWPGLRRVGRLAG